MKRIARRWRLPVLAGSIAVALTATGIVALTANAADDQEFVPGGDFAASAGSWYTYGGGPGTVVNGQYCFDPADSANPWDAAFGLNGLELAQGGEYDFSFDITSTVGYDIVGNVQLDADPYTGASSSTRTLVAGETAHVEATFTWPADHTAGIAIQVGAVPDGTAPTVCIDNVHLIGPPKATNLISNGTFDTDTAPWWGTSNISIGVVDGQLCAAIPGGTVNPWDVIIGYDGVPIVSGEDYTLSFRASASAPATIRALVQRNADPWPTVIDERPALDAELTEFAYSNTANFDEPSAQVAFQIGGSATPYTLCLDDIALKTGATAPGYEPDTGPRVKVNQVGYLPQGPKNATVVTEATDALAWELHDASSAVVASGTTTPQGLDATSGQTVHTIDFSGYTGTGGGFTLTADGETSFPFDIHDAVYDAMRIDALKFYYTQRSGIEILDSLRPGYGRPAGHVGVAPNQGDYDVPCMPDPANPAQRICDYTLDVVGGWYDAGDHGKYVVNGGISVYQLMSLYERTKYASTSDAGVLSDGSLALPESGNGVPDVLDEARWELEFLLSMQVPAGKPLAGMAHHKIHDHEWTGLPLLPSNDDKRRELHPPSTAATLNLAATAAQAARLYAPYDEAFADRALAAARTAYAAALANPDRYALVSDGNGGGAYDDLDVSDEFYWAAAELYLTTGERQYRDAVLASPHHTGNAFRPDGFDWKNTGAIGRLELATVPNNLPGRDAVRASVLAAADSYLAAQEASPYGITYAPASGLFEWGSNNLILNNLIVVAAAYDISGDARYRDGVVAGIDYILGRNALAQSYVTGYGEKASENQHSRWYAGSLNPALPHPPVGTLSGGPNSSIQDPRAQQFLQGCAPQFCYLDHIDSWSTNELTINWNSTFAWVSGFLADQGAGGAPPAPTGSVSYLQLDQRHGKFTVIVCVTNTSGANINGWQLRWAYTADQEVRVDPLINALLKLVGGNVSVAQDGPTVTVTSNKRLRPGQSATFVIHGNGELANIEPELFWLNGIAT